MLSYQHVYHAGSLSDVHKHAALVALIGRMRRLGRPVWFVDTHAGRGLYDLEAPEARRLREYEGGVARFWRHPRLPPSLDRWRVLVRRANPHGRLAIYPGSAALARALLGPDDRATLAELHPGEVGHLRRAMAGDPRFHVLHEDGLALLRRWRPPTDWRPLVAIDPSFEVKSEYATLPATVAEVAANWRGAWILLWYPVLPDARHAPMLDALASTLDRPATVFELTFPDPPAGARRGLSGSGLAAIGPGRNVMAAVGGVGDALAALSGGGADHVMRGLGPR